MEFLNAVIGYLLFCSIILFLYFFHDHLLLRPLSRSFYGCISFLRRLIPFRLRQIIEHIFLWFLFERHCLYQILYVLFVLLGHAVLITDVIAQLYRLSVVENHLFVGLASLFCNGLSYTLVCLTDPGVITSRNLPVYAHVYPYDGLVYTAKQCSKCLHQMPARSKHCARCDQCVFRFDHHCVWTNCCIGGQNHAHFLFFLASLLVMVLNATWLSFRVLHYYTVREGLWYAQYIDADNQIHPMDWPTLIQHLFMTFPRVVTMATILSCITVALLLYFLHHIRLLCRNQTSYEYNRLRVLMRPKQTLSSLPTPGTARFIDKYQWKINSFSSDTWFYNHGLWANVYEVFGWKTTNSLRELRRRLPVQMEFKTH